MVHEKKNITPVEGRSYGLFGSEGSTEGYYRTVGSILTELLGRVPDEHQLLDLIQNAGDQRSQHRSDRMMNDSLRDDLMTEVHNRLSPYTENTADHLRGMSVRQRFDPIIRTKEYQYHLYMLEIALVNRMYREPFQKSPWKFALIAHCLRDFRPGCRAVAGETERVCKDCTKDCFIHLGGTLLKKYGIHPFISTSMELERLFKELQNKHGNIGALGIACVPELVQGMRLCIKLGIAPVGIPLDGNRCARWMDKTRESSYSLKELEDLIR